MEKNNAKNNNAECAVIILNWNGIDDTLECIRSLINSNTPSEDIYVVDNGSDNEEGKKIKEKFPKINLVQNESNLGYCGGNNAGYRAVKKCSYKYSLILNNDTEVDSDTVTGLLGEIKKNRSVAAVGATIVDYYKRDVVQNRGLKYLPVLGLSFPVDFGSNISKESKLGGNTVSGACFIIDNDLLDNQLFDEDYFCYFEEVDLCQRLRKTGKRCVVSETKVYHKGEMTTKKVSGFYEYQMAKNRFLVVKKNGGLFTKTVFIVFSLTAYPIFKYLKNLKSPNITSSKYYWAGTKAGLKYFFCNKNIPYSDL